MEIQKRLPWVDLARGIAVSAIVYGHASRDVGLLARAAYAFHVPLCVFLTGFLYEYRGQPLKDHLKKSGYRLLLPYLIWSLLSIAVYMLMGKLAAGALGAETYSLSFNLRFMARGLSVGNAVLWYLPFLFNSYLLMELWCRFLKRRNPGRRDEKLLVILIPVVFSTVTLSVYSIYQYIYNIDFPFSINNACFLFLFLWLGYVVKKTVTLPQGKKWLLPAAALTVFGIAFAVCFNDEVEYMSFDHQEYGRNIGVFYSSALLICISICWLCRNLGGCRLLEWFGRNSMAIFLMHKFPVLFFQVILGDLGETMGKWQFLLFLSISFISMCLCCWVGTFLRRWLPWMLGEQKK